MKKNQTIIKSDTEENWNKAKNFIPKENEIILYTNFQPNGLKIGDGKTYLKNLPFVNNTEYFVEDDILIINTKEGGFIINGRSFKN